MNIKLLEATNADIPLIQRLANEIWPGSFSKILSPMQIEYMMNMMYATKSLEEQFEKNHQYFIISLDNEAVGYCSYEHNNEGQAQTKIHKIYIKAKYRGMGLGTYVINRIKTLSIVNENSKLVLNVNRYNKGAVKTYQKIGFEIVKTIDINIGNGYLMEDYVMVWKYTIC